MPRVRCRKCDHPMIVRAEALPTFAQAAEMSEAELNGKVLATKACGGCELPEALCDCEKVTLPWGVATF